MNGKAFGLMAGSVLSGAALADVVNFTPANVQPLTLPLQTVAPFIITIGDKEKPPLKSSPAISFGSQVGYGLVWGDVAAGGGCTLHHSGVRQQKRRDGADDKICDGSAGFSFGLGSADTVGLTVTTNVISLVGFGDDGSMGFKLHKPLDRYASVAIGTDAVLGWGQARPTRENNYFAYSQAIPLTAGGFVFFNMGYGSQRIASRTGGGGAFGGVAIAPYERISFVIDYIGYDLNTALSVVPFRSLPVTVTVGAVNLTEADGNRRALAASGGLIFRF